MKRFLIFFFLVSQICTAATWTQAQLDSIFERLYSEGALVASTEVESYGVSAFDFGMDLHSIGKIDESIAWFNALALAGGDACRFKVGKAWVEMSSGRLQVAMTTANEILGRSDCDSLASARAHYLLGAIYYEAGSRSYASTEFSAALAIYIDLELEGGKRLCSPFLSKNKAEGTGSLPSLPAEPPRDDTDS